MEENKKINFEIQDRRAFIKQKPVKDAFIEVLKGVHRMSDATAESMYKREIVYIDRFLQEDQKLAQSTQISLFSAFLEIATNNLSAQPGSRSLCYFETRSGKATVTDPETKKNKEIWIYVARLAITAYGELEMRIRAKQIVRAYNPIVLYEGDTFQPRTNQQGRLIVEYAAKIPRAKDAKIFGCYIALQLPDGNLDFKWLLEDDIERLAKYSTPRQTAYNPEPKANALYTSNGNQIDPGFLEAKTIKHAFRSYGKLAVGDSVSFEGDYGNTEEDAYQTPQAEQIQTPQVEGVQVKPENDDVPY